MSERVFNFSAGPSTLPREVLEEARDNLLCLDDAGAGILELSHRGPHYSAIHEAAEADLRELLGAGDEWALLFLQGGASTQFTMVPQNLGADADYVLTGTWAKKAVKEAQKLGSPRVAGSSEESGFDRIPALDSLDLNPQASYLHITSNNTIFGTQWQSAPEVEAPLVCDASSDILSRPLELDRYALVYAGAQKNLGPAGVTLVLVRQELLARSPESLPTMLNYNTHEAKGSLFNTGPVFSIYMVGLVAKWLKAQGGAAAMGARNQAKADALYAAIDGHDLYQGHAQPDSRSQMNVTFRLGDAELEARFVKEAAARGMTGLKGHRSVGGIRASIYNAMPQAGVDALVAFMAEFAQQHG